MSDGHQRLFEVVKSNDGTQSINDCLKSKLKACIGTKIIFS